jgi:hypothetical protein
MKQNAFWWNHPFHDCPDSTHRGACSKSGNVNRLEVGEFTNPIFGQLATKAGALAAAEGQPHTAPLIAIIA